ncbi:MAG: glycosyltransferase [Pseudonocardiaceae bacterium]|jgi:hopene-associated glycosyltransferase HpnB|nr:glycosyltransferase [Pseudonocardiaceae bacterium]
MPLLGRLATASAVAWAYLVVGHGGFWLASPRLPAGPPEPDYWPSVGVVVPARDEAAVLPETLPTLLAQDYPGELAVWLVDDGSTDTTASLARSLADQAGTSLTVLTAPPPPPGWTGKLNAVQHGVEFASAIGVEFLLLTDADIAHHPSSVRRLVATALADSRELVSLMALLRVQTGWERLLVPAFVYYFAQLYPFPRVSRRGGRTAAAAGGCVLVHRTALARAGGLTRIRGELIDDVALGRLLKRSGARIWLGFTGDPPEVRSVRPYPHLADLWTMVTRSAYTQLRRSPVLLAGTLAGLGLLYIVPPIAALAGLARRSPMPAAAGFGAWAAMAATQAPVLRLYGLSPLRGLILPAVATLYAAMTVDSARRHATGHGGAWKGRLAAPDRGATR